VDSWKFYDITHADHLHANPISPARMEELMGLLDLPPRAQVLDLGCGRAELLVRLAERYGIVGVGIDKSPYAIKRAREEAHRRPSDGQLVFFHPDGADYFAPPGTFDLAMCLGATWMFQGHRGTLQALARFVRPGGLVMVGQPYWIHRPAPEYLAAISEAEDVYGTHAENMLAGEHEGLAPLYALVSSHDDWDRYEGLQWRATARFAAANPEDPDLVELLSRVGAGRAAYLKWGRDSLGWAIYLFRR
jgi:SAM-dependent methyltransferase